MATEAALGVKIPNTARIVRNIIESAQFLHGHILWFYQLATWDYVDALAAQKASITRTYALAQKSGTTTSDFEAVQARAQGLVFGSGDSPSSRATGSAPRPTRLSPEFDLLMAAHYLEAICRSRRSPRRSSRSWAASSRTS